MSIPPWLLWLAGVAFLWLAAFGAVGALVLGWPEARAIPPTSRLLVLGLVCLGAEWVMRPRDS